MNLEIKKEIKFQDKGEYTFNIYDNYLFSKHSAYQSLFNGSLIRRTDIEYMNFSRCDFEGTILEKVKIYDTNFYHTYFQTAICADVVFDVCTFETANLSNTTFKECTFNNCNFELSTLNKAKFENCSFVSCKFTGANVTLCKFDNCKFSNIKFGDCSFYQQIMLNNYYENVSINIDSLGQVFGITFEDIKCFSYIFLGEEYGKTNTKVLENIAEIYQLKHWSLAKIIYEYNIGKSTCFEFIEAIHTELNNSIKNKRIIKQIDIEFITTIIYELKEMNKLPFFSLYLGILNLNESILTYENSYYSEIIHLLKNYINSMISLIRSMILDLIDRLEYLFLFPQEQKVLFSIHYESDRNLEIYKVIDQISNKFYGTHVVLQEVKEGSIVETMATVAASIFIFQLCLYGINGCVIQMIDMKAKIKVYKDKKLQKNYIQNSVLGKQVQPELLRVVLDKLSPEIIKFLSKLLLSFLNLNIIDASIEAIDDNVNDDS